VRALVNLKLFNIYVRDTRVRKGYDWLVLPDGRRVSVAPGKYMLITPSGFGFEDMTEEIGEKPDYDYNEPVCVVSESGFVVRTVTVKCRLDGVTTVDLYYGDKLVVPEIRAGREYTGGFTYVSLRDVAITAGAGGAIAVLVYLLTKRRR
jgi:hypothetical protein